MGNINHDEKRKKVDYVKRMLDNLKLMGKDLFLADKKDEPLYDFAKLSEEERKNSSLLGKTITIENDEYIVNRNGKDYHFVPYSRNDIRENDIERIREGKFSYRDEAIMALEIAGSHKLVEPLFLFGTCNGDYKFLVEYNKNGKRYIIDIMGDMIMESNDYRELMNFEEIRNLDINEIYLLYYVMEEMDGKIHILYFLLFYKEIMPYFTDLLESEMHLSYLDGVNIHNINMVDNHCDAIFKLLKFAEKKPEFDDINKITMYPDKYESIKDKKGCYNYKDYEIFLLSDFLEGDNEDLLSDERFGKCHTKVYSIAKILKQHYVERKRPYDIKIVTGNAYYHTKRSIYHSWVEIYDFRDHTWYVIDYTQNLVMKKEDFYQYVDIEVLESIDFDEYNYLGYLFKEFDIDLSSRLTTMFATNLLSDLTKNIRLLK